MCADCCYEDYGVVGVAEGAAGREVVGGAAGGGGDADAVGLDGCDVVFVAEDFDAGHCCGWGGVGSVFVLADSMGVWLARGWLTWIRSPIQH